MFRDRAEAGQLLSEKLRAYTHSPDTVVLGLPRGGVPVAYEIAKALHLPLGVLLVRKLGAPSQPELALGAIAANGVKVMDQMLVDRLGISHQELASIVAREEEELRQREALYGRAAILDDLKNRTAIIVDDGIATGASMKAATQVLNQLGAAKIVVAVPVAPPHAQWEFEAAGHVFVCLRPSEYFPAVGWFYRDFSQVEDETVRWLLSQARSPE